MTINIVYNSALIGKTCSLQLKYVAIHSSNTQGNIFFILTCSVLIVYVWTLELHFFEMRN